MIHNNLTFPIEALQYDTYQGITLHVSKLPSHFFLKINDDGSTLFEHTLRQSLLRWKEQKYRGIWVHIPTHLSPITLPFCIQELKFDFRHAYAGNVILTHWLPDPEEHANKLPWGPTHQVGVGAVILHPRDKSKILVVQEKSGPAAANQLWKMPTGLTDPGEDIPEAVIREVREETGFHVQFQQIICIRQAHSSGRSSGGSLGHSDLFFVCLASCDYESMMEHNNVILEAVLNQQHDEIANIQWMDLEEYANQKLWKISPLYNEMNDAVRQCVNHYSPPDNSKDTTNEQETNEEQNNILHSAEPHGFIAKTLPIGFRPGVNTIYVSKL